MKDWNGPVAHRGLHRPGVPENSLAALDDARRLGLAIELDVRVTSDGRAVVHHDVDLRRMCATDSRVSDLTLGQVADLLIAGTEHRVPSLAAALDLIGRDVPVLIDCKVRPTARDRGRMLDAVLRDLLQHKGSAAILSFDPWLLAAFRREAPGVQRGQSSGVSLREARIPHTMQQLTAPLDRFWFNRVSRPHFLTYNVDRLPQPVLAGLRETGLPVLGWTVKRPEQLAVVSSHVDNVIAEGHAMEVLLGRPAVLAG